jgi:hypothetical protein
MEPFYGLNIQYKKKDDKIISGIFPFKEMFKNYSKKTNILGGSKNEIEGQGSRFDGLGVPLGLYLSNNDVIFNQHLKIKNNDEVLDNDIFDKLINNIMILKNNKTKNNKTKKNTTKKSFLNF